MNQRIDRDQYNQARRSRPGPDNAYSKIIKWRFDIDWRTNAKAIAYDCKSDGMHPSCSVGPICPMCELEAIQLVASHQSA